MHQRDHQHDQTDEHHESVMVLTAELAEDQIAGLGQHESQHDRADEQVQRMEQHDPETGVIGLMHPAIDELHCHDRVHAVERRQRQQTLRHLPLGPQLVLELDDHRRRGRHADGRDEYGRERRNAEHTQHDIDRDKGEQSFERTGDDDPGVGPHPFQVEAAAQFEQQ